MSASPQPHTTVSPQDHSEVEARALAALSANHPKDALTILMDAYGQDIYRFCHQLTRDPALAEDLRQVTFVQAYEGLDGFTQRASMRAWLYTIARNRCLDALKGRRRWRKRFFLDDTVEQTAPSQHTDPASELDRPALERALSFCLSKLKPDLRSLILMRHQQDLSYVELESVFGAAPATLQARVARSLPKLRRCLDAQGVSI